MLNLDVLKLDVVTIIYLGGFMLLKITKSVVYSGVITGIYFIAANLMYWVFNRQSMFADPYFYEWVEYLVVAGVIFVTVSLMEMARYFFYRKAEASNVKITF